MVLAFSEVYNEAFDIQSFHLPPSAGALLSGISNTLCLAFLTGFCSDHTAAFHLISVNALNYGSEIRI